MMGGLFSKNQSDNSVEESILNKGDNFMIQYIDNLDTSIQSLRFTKQAINRFKFPVFICFRNFYTKLKAKYSRRQDLFAISNDCEKKEYLPFEFLCELKNISAIVKQHENHEGFDELAFFHYFGTDSKEIVPIQMKQDEKNFLKYVSHVRGKRKWFIKNLGDQEKIKPEFQKYKQYHDKKVEKMNFLQKNYANFLMDKMKQIVDKLNSSHVQIQEKKGENKNDTKEESNLIVEKLPEKQNSSEQSSENEKKLQQSQKKDIQQIQEEVSDEVSLKLLYKSPSNHTKQKIKLKTQKNLKIIDLDETESGDKNINIADKFFSSSQVEKYPNNFIFSNSNVQFKKSETKNQGQESQQKPDNGKVKLCCRTYFYNNEVILQPESETIQFKAYRFPLKSSIIERLKKTICGFLNCKGGTIFIGIQENMRNKKHTVVGGIYNEYIKQEILKNCRSIFTTISPGIIFNSKAKVSFIPVKNEDFPYNFEEGNYVIKIKIAPGIRNELYTYKNDEFDYFSAIRTENEILVFDFRKDARKLLDFQKQRILNPLPEVKSEHYCLQPELGLPLYQDQEIYQNRKKYSRRYIPHKDV